MRITCVYDCGPKRPTCNTAFVESAFGIAAEERRVVVAKDVELEYSAGEIVLFLGPSGSGKSSLLCEMARRVEGALFLEENVDGRDAIIDGLGLEAREAAHLLSLCGLGDALLMLRSPEEMSDGQRYRFALAKALATGAKTVVADEWCAKLDRITAKVLSRNARKLADRRGVGLLLATAHEGVVEDLQPDRIVHCRGDGVVEVERRRPFRGPISFSRRLQITAGTVQDWAYFARWHYRGGKLGPVRRVLVLWHDRRPIGICVFGFGPLTSRGRNRHFGLPRDLTKALVARINRNVACVTRLVIDPRYRGVGIASAFLRRACRLSPWPWVELAGEMAKIVPFCEAAGFTRVALPPKRARGSLPPWREAQAGRGPYGKSRWTAAGYAAYVQRVRFGRPAYYVFDNRSNCSGTLARGN